MIVLGLFTFLQGFLASFNWTTASGWGGRTGGQSSFADVVLDTVLVLGSLQLGITKISKATFSGICEMPL